MITYDQVHTLELLFANLLQRSHSYPIVFPNPYTYSYFYIAG